MFSGVGFDDEDIPGLYFHASREARHAPALANQAEDFNVAFLGGLVELGDPLADDLGVCRHDELGDVIGQVEKILTGVGVLTVFGQ